MARPAREETILLARRYATEGVAISSFKGALLLQKNAGVRLSRCASRAARAAGPAHQEGLLYQPARSAAANAVVVAGGFAGACTVKVYVLQGDTLPGQDDGGGAHFAGNAGNEDNSTRSLATTIIARSGPCVTAGVAASEMLWPWSHSRSAGLPQCCDARPVPFCVACF